jgi:hypothetical protein
MVARLRSSRPTPWAGRSEEPEGPGGFGPITSQSVSSVVPLRISPACSISDQIHLGKMVPFRLNTL